MIQNKEVVPMMAIVAELMIWANESVAKKLVSCFPTSALVRTHEPPPLDAFEEVRFTSMLCPEAVLPLSNERLH